MIATMSGGNGITNALIKMWTSQGTTLHSATVTTNSTNFQTQISAWTTLGDDLTMSDWEQISAPPRPDPNKIQKRMRDKLSVSLPDGGQFVLEPDGSYRVVDSAAKITYQANRVREFNRYINASDLLEEFVHYLASMGLNRDEILNVPINLFIAFLVVRAAETDGEPTPRLEERKLLALPAPKRKLKCKLCGRFVPSFARQAFLKAMEA